MSERTGRLKNIIVKNLLGSIAHDSKKHAELYNGLIKYLGEVGTALSEEEFDELNRIVEEHLKLEEDMIKIIEDMLKWGNCLKWFSKS